MKATGSKHLHVIGICGVATSAIAIALKKSGWKITGSDKGFYPPISRELEKAGIPFSAGWHPEKMGKPDLVMTGGSGTSPNNPETLYARENQIPLYPYPAILEKYFIKKNSIVTAGTWGKTTNSALLSFILEEAGYEPSYFTGGVSLSHPAANLTDSTWSVVEGDEYQVSIDDRRPKFVYYHPSHLLLTSVSWDHADLYPTEESYFQVFTKLVADTSVVIACLDNPGVKKIVGQKEITSYGQDQQADFRYHSVKPTGQGLDFTIEHQGQAWTIHSPMLGRFNAENLAGCFALAYTIGIEPSKIIEAIKKFQGIKRRFEKRYVGKVTVLDCHAPTPEKASSVLENLREIYQGKIIAVYEPNTGGRQRASAHLYDHLFVKADQVFIPRLTKLKIAETDKDKPLEGAELALIISKTHKQVEFIEDDETLIKKVTSQLQKDDCLVFLGSHGFRGMIESAITSLRQQSL